MAGFLDVLAPWIQLLAPQPCYDEFFVKFNFFHVACLKVLISKCLGYAIILGSVLVKIPQILKIIQASSAEGISIVGTSLELTAISANLAYSFAQGYPFSAYGESAFLLLQTWIIAFLVLFYGGKTTTSALYSAVFAAVLAFLLSPAAPAQLLWALQASVIPNIVMARAIQAYQNFSNGHTGQLSAITVFLLFFGALARVFTSIQETGDSTIILMYVVSSSCTGVLAFQILYYWNAKPKKE